MAWLTYVAAMTLCLPGKGLTLWQWVRTFAASLFPFGTFLNDPLLRRKEQARLRSRLEPSGLWRRPPRGSLPAAA